MVRRMPKFAPLHVSEPRHFTCVAAQKLKDHHHDAKREHTQKTSSHVLHRILPGDPRERKEHVFKTLFGREARREAHQRILELMEYFGTLDYIVCATPNPVSVAWNMAATCDRQCPMFGTWYP